MSEVSALLHSFGWQFSLGFACGLCAGVACGVLLTLLAFRFYIKAQAEFLQNALDFKEREYGALYKRFKDLEVELNHAKTALFHKP